MWDLSCIQQFRGGCISYTQSLFGYDFYSVCTYDMMNKTCFVYHLHCNRPLHRYLQIIGMIQQSTFFTLEIKCRGSYICNYIHCILPLLDEHTESFSVHYVILVVQRLQLVLKNRNRMHFLLYKPKLDYPTFKSVCQFVVILKLLLHSTVP